MTTKKKKDIENFEDCRRFDELTKGFWLKQPLLIQTKDKQLCSSDSPKDWFFKCEATSYTNHKILDDTKEVNGKHAICWNPNVESYSMRWAAKPEILQGY